MQQNTVQNGVVFCSISWKLGYRYTKAIFPHAMEPAPNSEKGATILHCSLNVKRRRLGTQFNPWITCFTIA